MIRFWLREDDLHPFDHPFQDFMWPSFSPVARVEAVPKDWIDIFVILRPGIRFYAKNGKEGSEPPNASAAFPTMKAVANQRLPKGALHSEKGLSLFTLHLPQATQTACIIS